MTKVTVPFNVDPADLQTIYLAVIRHTGKPAEDEWRPAYRDTDDTGRSIVWIKVDDPSGVVWIRDRTSTRVAAVR